MWLYLVEAGPLPPSNHGFDMDGLSCQLPSATIFDLLRCQPAALGRGRHRQSGPRVTLQVRNHHHPFRLLPRFGARGPSSMGDLDLRWRRGRRGVPISARQFDMLCVGTHKPGVSISPGSDCGRTGQQKDCHGLEVTISGPCRSPIRPSLRNTLRPRQSSLQARIWWCGVQRSLCQQ